MAKFAYRALNKDGSEVSGRQDAVSQKAAFDELKERGLYPVSISPESPPRRLFGARKLSRTDLSQTVRQLATLLSAGVPLLAAVESLVRSNMHPELSDRATKLTQHLRSGEHLPSGLEKFYPELPVYVSKLAELGDATGKTAETLTDAADRMNLSLLDEKLGLLLVPQFTLAADTKKGTRASFTRAAAPEMGKDYFEQLVGICRQRLEVVETGEFGANMQVSLVNDGPVTFWLET